MAKPKAASKISRKELLSSARAAVNKKFAKEGIMSRAASEALEHNSVWVSTGSMALDRLTRGWNPGGIPVGPTRGRVVHIAGVWSSGKSLILDHIFKSTQSIGGLCYVAEAEATREPHFAEMIGLNLRELEITIGLPSLEVLFAHMLDWHEFIRKHDPHTPIVMGVDSLDSTEAGKTADKDISEGKAYMYGGGRSEVLGLALRRLTNRVCARYPTTIVLLNQVRQRPGVTYGDDTYTPGGNPPHFYASLEIKLADSPLGAVRGAFKGAKLTGEQRKRLGFTKTETGDIIGRWIRARVSKTKVSNTYLQFADFYLSFERGVGRGAGLLNRLLAEGKVAMSGKNIITHAGKAFDGGSIAASEALWGKWLAHNLDVLGPTKEELETEAVINNQEPEPDDAPEEESEDGAEDTGDSAEPEEDAAD